MCAMHAADLPNQFALLYPLQTLGLQFEFRAAWGLAHKYRSHYTVFSCAGQLTLLTASLVKDGSLNFT